MATRTDHSTLLTYEEVATILRIHPQTLRQWVSSKKFPHLKIGSNVRFTLEMIDQYIKSTLVEPKSANPSKTENCSKAVENA